MVNNWGNYKWSKEKSRVNESASLDRFDNTKGYIRSNVKIISNRANELKSDGTLEEFIRLVEYLKS